MLFATFFPTARLSVNGIVSRPFVVQSMIAQEDDARLMWVVTVPAIWSNFGKRFMRAASHRAGLIADENDMQVSAVLRVLYQSFTCNHILLFAPFSSVRGAQNVM